MKFAPFAEVLTVLELDGRAYCVDSRRASLTILLIAEWACAHVTRSTSWVHVAGLKVAGYITVTYRSMIPEVLVQPGVADISLLVSEQEVFDQFMNSPTPRSGFDQERLVQNLVTVVRHVVRVHAIAAVEGIHAHPRQH